jgi:hypothetical protein
LITQNELARQKTKETNLFCVSKAEEVNEDLWEQTSIMLSALSEERKKVKELLITARKETLERIPKNVGEQTEEISNSNVLSDQRLQPKIIEVGPFKVFAGGNIEQLKHKDEIGNKTGPQNTQVQEKPTITVSNKPAQQRSSVYTGINLKNVSSNFKSKRIQGTRAKSRSGGTTSSLPRSNKQTTANKIKISKYSKYIAIALAPVFFLIFANSYLSKTTIKITPKTQPKTISDTLTADPNVNQIDPEQKIIPAKVITKTKSGSESAPTTGSTPQGDKAIGTTYVYNKTEREITLNPGHKITSLNDQSLSFE